MWSQESKPLFSTDEIVQEVIDNYLEWKSPKMEYEMYFANDTQETRKDIQAASESDYIETNQMPRLIILENPKKAITSMSPRYKLERIRFDLPGASMDLYFNTTPRKFSVNSNRGAHLDIHNFTNFLMRKGFKIR